MKKKTLIALLFLIVQVTAQDRLYQIATMTGEKPGDAFSSLIFTGDVNGDGFDDLLISASTGRYAKLYFGGTSWDSIENIRIKGDRFYDAGDVNGDGFDDIAIINDYPFYSDVNMYFGGAEFDTIPDLSFQKQFFSLYSSLTGVGDVNNDGFNDYIIGNSNAGTTCIGCSYRGTFLFLGGDTLKISPSLTFNTNEMSDAFGQSICGCDVNHDGFNDILIGAPWSTETNTGKVYIYHGGTQMDTHTDSILYRADCPGYSMFGFDMTNAGDINGDGKDEIFIFTGNNYFLYPSNDSCISMTGASIGAGGDINNDGFNDFVIGNTNYINISGVMVGQVQGYYGCSVLDTTADFYMEGENKWGEFSRNLTIAGDINGDGFNELIVGAPGFPDYQNPSGKVYIYSFVKWYTGIDKNEFKNPSLFRLYQNYPNPFNKNTIISFEIKMKNPNRVMLKILNNSGKEVAILLNETQREGKHQLLWDGKNQQGIELPSGVYFCKLETGNFTKTIKVIMLK